MGRVTSNNFQPAKNMIEEINSQSKTVSTIWSPAADGYALIRVCDTCGKVNAIDLDASEAHENEMQEVGHTVKRMSKAEAKEAWKTAGRCDHEALIKELRETLESLMPIFTGKFLMPKEHEAVKKARDILSK